eukprot:Protomagalhaensia_sp_Gyna_25__1539@NODE_1792_length_1536_cov_5_016032_g1470_i0_p1_GENE_NODE_1792_length_1536_cov_5_016032_g1470_i0NODE_1792_length_1536_cov_5_016032_g1470_i0_p1_ORF_typecomplete_len305_score28_31PAP2/PF01569_21/1_4e26PAP2_3/PF14378_6/9_7e08ArAE_2_N/PF10337_9/0_02Spore_permease/PF03845_13/0_016Spore_permease/PF03845_13/9_7e02FUSC/PF04632_12/0_17Polysacc_synt_3/PF13440_6/1Polysacc_synt_3/PF13440_6/53DUF212/PF02681_14/1_3DUF212/PF02681_14/1_2e02DUF5368/PF17336_2/85DUF5368/PF17336_2/
MNERTGPGGADSTRFYTGVFRAGWLGKEVLLRVLLMCFVGGLLLIPPFKRRIQPEKWYKYRYPFTTNEAVPAWLASTVLMVSPILNLTVMLYLIRKKRTSQQLYRQAVLYGLGLWLSLGFAILTCEVVKRFYGGLRPDFLSRCFGTDDSRLLIKISNTITSSDPLECKHTPYSRAVIRDGRMSFPSEHSATAFAVFVFMGLWNMERIKSIEGYGAQALIVPAICLAIPLLIAVSRTSDYRHHPVDVVFGIAIGAVVAGLTFFFYFPHKRRPRDPPGYLGGASDETQPELEYGLHESQEKRPEGV